MKRWMLGLLLMGLALISNAQSKQEHADKGKLLQELRDNIPGITEQQIEALRQIREKYAPQRKELKQSAEKQKGEMKALRDQQRAEISKVLNPEQMRAFEQLMKERHQEHLQHKAGGPPPTRP